jgi:hypothetical protein
VKSPAPAVVALASKPFHAGLEFFSAYLTIIVGIETGKSHLPVFIGFGPGDPAVVVGVETFHHPAGEPACMTAGPTIEMAASMAASDLACLLGADEAVAVAIGAPETALHPIEGQLRRLFQRQFAVFVLVEPLKKAHAAPFAAVLDDF